VTSSSDRFRTPHACARGLRRDQTEAEKLSWSRPRDAHLDGIKFHHQFPIGEFIADFAGPAARLAIELDGAQHVDRAEQDQWRNRVLAEHGHRVLRFWNEEVLTNIERALERIAHEIEAKRSLRRR